ncbi:hypothetical protein CYMTET_25133, partial [Cymbomonas tetramitiformis]
MDEQLLSEVPGPTASSSSFDARLEYLHLERAQFGAMFRKNILLKSRGKLICGLGGYVAVFVELLLPVVFFALMCLPKALVAPHAFDTQLSQAYPLASRLWSSAFACDDLETLTRSSSHSHRPFHRIIYTPPDPTVERTVDWIAKVIACYTSPTDLLTSKSTASRLSASSSLINTSAFPGTKSFTEMKEGEGLDYSALLHLFETFPAYLLRDGGTHCRKHPECCWEPSPLDPKQGYPNPACYNMSHCWRPYRNLFLPSKSEEDAVELATAKAGNENSYYAVLVFTDTGGGDEQEPRDDGTEQLDRRFTIRMPASKVPTTLFWRPLYQIQPNHDWKCGASYWFFANLQSAAQQAMSSAHNCSTVNGCAPVMLETWVKSFPWHAYSLDLGALYASLVLRMLLIFAFISPFQSCVKAVVCEKELRLREGMALLGLREGVYWGSWFTIHFGMLAASTVLMVAVSVYPFQYSSPVVMLVFFLEFSVALVLFAYFVSTFFARARVAGTGALFIYLLSLVPGYLMPVVETYGGPGRVWACLLPPSALAVWSEVLLTLEVGEVGVTWGSLGAGITQTDPFTAQQCMQMLAVDIVLYAALTWYCDRVVPREWGTTLPWYFPFMPWYWVSSPAVHDGTAQGVEQGEEEGGAPAVRIRGLHKAFPSSSGPRLAVNDVTLDIHRGYVTGLLGHNGAGKTTLISILTGLLEPTSGTVCINGHSISSGMGAIRRSLGLCPQYDILWPEITVKEHLELFAHFKGISAGSVPALVARSVQQVALQGKLHTQAQDLSGGQRRKLSLAIAFLGEPSVVFLDEPTSGMDPCSRRFTWDVIRRNQAGRVVVLTTHFMDEADLLCTQIAIMAAGRVVANGSPLELKSRYGHGYTLTVVPRVDGEPGAAVDLEAFTAAIAGVVRAHVPECRLLGCAGREIRMQLPLAAAPCFPQMLRALEAAKPHLPLGAFGISMGTMEEVFLRVQAELAGDAGAVGDASGDGSSAVLSPSEGGSQPAGLIGAHPMEELTSDGPPFPVSTSPAAQRGVDQRRASEPIEGLRETALEEPLLAAADAVRGSWDQHEARRWPGEEGSGGGEGGALREATMLQQMYALVVKRALNSARDRLAVLTQLVAPVAFALLALVVARVSQEALAPPARTLTRDWAMGGQSIPYGNASALDAHFAFADPVTWDPLGARTEYVADVAVDVALSQLNASRLDIAGECAQCDLTLYNLQLLQQGLGNLEDYHAHCPRRCAAPSSMEVPPPPLANSTVERCGDEGSDSSCSVHAGTSSCVVGSPSEKSTKRVSAWETTPFCARCRSKCSTPCRARGTVLVAFPGAQSSRPAASRESAHCTRPAPEQAGKTTNTDALLRSWDDNSIQYAAVYVGTGLEHPHPTNITVRSKKLEPQLQSVVDAGFLTQLPPAETATVLVNDSSYHALPAALAELHSAAAVSGGLRFTVTSHPLPLQADDSKSRDIRALGDFLLTICMSMS